MNTNRTAIYLHEGRAWVAELKEGRAQVSSLSAWLSAHPGRCALRALAIGPQPPPAPRRRVPRSVAARGGLASLLGRLLRRASRYPHPDVDAG
jgi:hypothetical protein